MTEADPWIDPADEAKKSRVSFRLAPQQSMGSTYPFPLVFQWTGKIRIVGFCVENGGSKSCSFNEEEIVRNIDGQMYFGLVG